MNHKNIGIEVSENGYIITANKKTYIFDDIKKMRTWIEENVAPTKEIQDFSNALDDEKPESILDSIYFSANKD